MAWFVVPCLNEGRDQFDARFPGRDKTTDGSIGDQDHAARASSHNPDLTGRPEHRDGDSRNEVRARDIDADLNDPQGVKMEDAVQLLVKKAREGKLWFIRYIIYRRRIWHKRDGYVTREYMGSNPHGSHVHLNSDFTQEADEVTGTNWFLNDLGAPTAPRPVRLRVDGELGPKTIRRWQEIMGTKADGVISKPSQLVRAVQRKLNAAMGAGLRVDGYGIRQNGKFYKTTAALQRYLKTPVDGRMSVPKSMVVMALQLRLNEGRF